MKTRNKDQYSPGATVSWKWLGRDIYGVIKEIYTEPITKLIKGKSIKRNGTLENPAYVVESAAGNLALKLQSELKLATASSAPEAQKSRPKMFA